MTPRLERRRWRIGLYLGGVICAATLWVWVYGAPRVRTALAIRAERAAAAVEHSRLTAQAEALPRARAALEYTEAELQARLDGLPPEAGLPDLARTLAAHARRSGLEVLDASLELAVVFGPEPPAPDTAITRLPLRLLVRGSYGAIGRFLEAVAETGAVVEWETVGMDRSDAVPGSVEAEIRMNLYAATGASGAVPADGAAPAGPKDGAEVPVEEDTR